MREDIYHLLPSTIYVYQHHHHHFQLPHFFFSHLQSSPPTTHPHPNGIGCRNHHPVSSSHSSAAVAVSSPRPWRLLCSGCNSWAVSTHTPRFAPSLTTIENIKHQTSNVKDWNKRSHWSYWLCKWNRKRTFKNNMPVQIQRPQSDPSMSLSGQCSQVPSRAGSTGIIMYRHSRTFVGKCFGGRNNTCTRWPWGTCPRPTVSNICNGQGGEGSAYQWVCHSWSTSAKTYWKKNKKYWTQ